MQKAGAIQALKGRVPRQAGIMPENNRSFCRADQPIWIVGNWKMHGTRDAMAEALAIGRGAQMLNASPLRNEKTRKSDERLKFVLCPPAILLREMAQCLDADGGRSGMDGRARVALGGQDCHWAPEGPYTGDISAQMLADAGADYVLVGHSERRTGHHENGPMIRAKGMAAIAAGLVPIFCVGENSRGEGIGIGARTISAQLGEALPQDPALPLIIAYEPNWAIGTGMIPEGEEIAEMAALLRYAAAQRSPVLADQIVILYGGSVRPENAGAILGLPGINGVLVGGASLSAEKFLAIGASAIAPVV